MALLDRKSRLGATLAAAATAGLVAAPAYAQEQPQMQQASVATSVEQCAPLYRTSTGREVDASFSAYEYSKTHIGAVGISIFPGQDLTMAQANSIGTKLATAFTNNGVEAACFIHNERGPNGSGFGYKVAGQSWNTNGPLNISEATDVNTLRGVAAEARTARSLLASDQSGSAPDLALRD